MDKLRTEGVENIEARHEEEFPGWFEERV